MRRISSEAARGQRSVSNAIFKTGLSLALTLTMTVILVGGVSMPAFAGDTLYFQTGPVPTVDEAASSSVQSSSSDGQRSRTERQRSKETRYYVVQFRNKIRAKDRRNLTSLGARIVRYVPDDAFIVTMTEPVALTIVRSSLSIRTVLPFDPKWKVSPEFEPPSVFTADKEYTVLVRLFPRADEKTNEEKIRVIKGIQVESVQGRSLIVKLKLAHMDELASVDGIEWLQPQAEMELFALTDAGWANAADRGAGDYTDLTGSESGTKLINANAAWERGFTGRNQVVAMADSGLDSGDPATLHADFAQRVSTGFAYGLFAQSWEDPMGHGTHVAGSVLGNGKASGDRLRGAAFEASMIPEGMWSPMIGNLTVPPKLREIFQKPYDAGARIHTNSWGSPQHFGAYDGYAQQVDEFTFANPDMLIIFAAGNSGVDTDRDGRVDSGSIASPGTAKNALTVGASKNQVLTGGIQKALKDLPSGLEKWPVEPLASSKLSENSQGLAAFSARGPTQDGRLKPEVVAPGTNILSVRSQHPEAQALWGAYSQDYAWAGGTSMSAPLVAGAAAVARQYLIEDRKIPNPSAALMKAVLMHTATDLFPGQFGEGGKSRGQELLTHRPNMDQGYGRVDMSKATDLSRSLIIDERNGLAAAESHSYPIRISQRAKLTATLVYTDAPAAAGVTKSLVNDLDLVVIDSATGQERSTNDHVNNSEMVEIDVEAGAFDIKVKGTNVPQGAASGKQPYALVISVN